MPNVLIVDDEFQILEILTDEFIEAGFQVTKATSGNEAISILEKGSFDVIVSDFKMPNGNGIEILKFVRALPANQQPLFFFQSGYTAEFSEDAYALGVTGIFNKPYLINDLISEVNRCLQP